MPSRRRSSGFVAAIICGALCVSSCSHAINDDGNDITNPLGRNTGVTTHILTLTPSQSDLGVGQGASITATYDGFVVPGNVPGAGPVITVSDPRVISCCALGIAAYSAGHATLTATYGGSTATLNFTVHQVNGVSAVLVPIPNTATGTAAWTPPEGVVVAAGAMVTFTMQTTGLSHNVVFDGVPGAPGDIVQNGNTTSANRVFAIPGTFGFTCTIHGETGLVTVVAQ